MFRRKIIFVLVMFFSSQFAIAHGGSSSGGPSACSYSPVNCHTAPVGPLPQYRMYFCVVPGPGSATNALFTPFFSYVDVQMFPVTKQVSLETGGGITYSGNRFTLHINNDVPLSEDGGYPATLSSPAFGYTNEPIQCWIK